MFLLKLFYQSNHHHAFIFLCLIGGSRINGGWLINQNCWRCMNFCLLYFILTHLSEFLLLLLTHLAKFWSHSLASLFLSFKTYSHVEDRWQKSHAKQQVEAETIIASCTSLEKSISLAAEKSGRSRCYKYEPLPSNLIDKKGKAGK